MTTGDGSTHRASMTAGTAVAPRQPHLRRSVLYMPGSNARALEKARSLPVDTVILDLEDAVAPAQKRQARDAIAAAVRAGGYAPREVVVRVNGSDSEWGSDDLRAVATVAAHVDAVLLPKVQSAADVLDAAHLLVQSGATHRPALWAMVETPQGITAVEAICAASPRLDCLVLGTNDLAKDLRIAQEPERLGLLYALSRCVLAARAAGLDILDGVHPDLEDDAGLRASCEQGRRLGFDGKTLFHPRQVAAANELFSPSAEAVEEAHAIVAAWAEAQARGAGVTLQGGRLVEHLHVLDAHRVIALAEQVAARQPT